MTRHSFTRHSFVLALATVLTAGVLSARPAQAADQLCDPAFEDCRAILLNLIKNENVGIDVAFWFMEDGRYTNEIIKRFQAGVPVRVLVDPRSNPGTPINAQILQQLQDAGIPMRKKASNGILHWKMMLFAGQDVVEFSGANYSAFALNPVEPYDSYIDEAIAFVDDPSVTNSFRTKFDDLWTNTSDYANYANISGPLTRTYPTFTKDPELNWPPQESYRSRSVARYNAETVGIDVDMYRITDRAHTDAIIKAVQRGVPVRLYTEQREYRNANRPWVSWNVDRLYAAGVQVRIRGHEGLNHQKAVILKGQHMVIFGSSNWSSPSSDEQQEHNYFTTKPYFFNWFTDQFERKWNNSTGHIETAPFTPLPPDTPSYRQPANGATDRSTTNRQLTWYAGVWAHLYDIYFGTSPNPPLLASNVDLGPSFSTSDLKKFLLPSPLQPGTTYYWRIVSKTMADVQRSGPVWSFTTTGTAPGGSLPSGWSSTDIGDTGVQGSSTYDDPTFSVRGGGADVWGTADALQFAFRSLSGDGTITARVATVQNVASWTKAGVMIRASLSASSQQAFMLVSPGKGVAFQRRRTTGGSSVNTAGSSSTAPRWVRLTRSGSTITAFESSNGSTWTQVGSDNIAMPATIFVGLGVSSHVRGALAQATFDSVSVTVAAGQSLPSGWTDRDIGSVPITGSASYANGTYTVTGSGADIWGTADAFHYAYQTLSGDGGITARVVSVEFADRWSKGGVMIRAGTGASAAHAFMLVSAGKGVAFQRRPVAGGESVNTAGTLSSPPRWVRLTRTGSTFSAYESADGANWTLVGSQTISMPSTVEIGLAVTSHTTNSDSTVRFDNVVIDGGSSTQALPSGWDDNDIGNVPSAGSAQYASGTFTVTGSGADIWDNADAFHFAYTSLDGDGSIIARVASVEDVDRWTKAGVMIREDLTAGSPHAFMLVSAERGVAFQRRPAANGESVNTAGSARTAPEWVRLVRNDDQFNAYESTDGANWTLVGTDTIPMTSDVYVGLAVTSHTTAADATATFDNVVVE